jgi:hypothetical protein
MNAKGSNQWKTCSDAQLGNGAGAQDWRLEAQKSPARDEILIASWP